MALRIEYLLLLSMAFVAAVCSCWEDMWFDENSDTLYSSCPIKNLRVNDFPNENHDDIEISCLDECRNVSDSVSELIYPGNIIRFSSMKSSILGYGGIGIDLKVDDNGDLRNIDYNFANWYERFVIWSGLNTPTSTNKICCWIAFIIITVLIIRFNKHKHRRVLIKLSKRIGWSLCIAAYALFVSIWLFTATTYQTCLSIITVCILLGMLLGLTRLNDSVIKPTIGKGAINYITIITSFGMVFLLLLKLGGVCEP